MNSPCENRPRNTGRPWRAICSDLSTLMLSHAYLERCPFGGCPELFCLAPGPSILLAPGL